MSILAWLLSVDRVSSRYGKLFGVACQSRDVSLVMLVFQAVSTGHHGCWKQYSNDFERGVACQRPDASANCEMKTKSVYTTPTSRHRCHRICHRLNVVMLACRCCWGHFGGSRRPRRSRSWRRSSARCPSRPGASPCAVPPRPALDFAPALDLLAVCRAALRTPRWCSGSCPCWVLRQAGAGRPGSGLPEIG